MEPTVIYSDENIEAKYFPDGAEEGSPYLASVWNGHMELDRYKRVYNTLLDFAEERQCGRLFIDQTKLQHIDPRARAWLLSNYIPRIRKRIEGTLYLSLVLPENKFAEVMMQSLIFFFKKLFRGLEVKAFSDEAEARRWVSKTGAPSRTA